jgi:hypothetical protein
MPTRGAGLSVGPSCGAAFTRDHGLTWSTSTPTTTGLSGSHRRMQDGRWGVPGGSRNSPDSRPETSGIGDSGQAPSWFHGYGW